MSSDVDCNNSAILPGQVAGSWSMHSVGSQGTKHCCGRKKRHCGHGKRQIEPLGCWVTLAAAFGVNVMVAAAETAFALFYVPLEEKYNSTKANVGISASLLISCSAISGLLSSPFMNLFGCRPVAFVGATLMTVGLILSAFAPNLICFHISFGFLGGIGLGLQYIPSMLIVQQTFTHNRGLATGIALLGFTAGTILAPILFEYLLNEYGLFGSLLLQSAVYGENFVFIWAFKSPKRYRESEHINCNEDNPKNDSIQQDKSIEANNKQIKSKDKKRTPILTKSMWSSFCVRLLDFSICGDVKYVLYVFVRLLWFFARFCINTHIVSAATHLGIALKDARYLPAVMGMSNLVMRSFSTIVLNIRCLNKEVYFAVGIVCVSVAGFLAGFAKEYAMLLAAMILVGCNEGTSTTAQQLVVVNLVGVDKFPKAMSIIELGTVPASLAAGPFSGWLVDFTGNYKLTFVVAGSAGCIAFLLITIIIILLHVQKKSNKLEKSLSVTCAVQEMQPLRDKQEMQNEMNE